MIKFHVTPTERCRVFAFNGEAFEVFQPGIVEAERLHVWRLKGVLSHMAQYYHDDFMLGGIGCMALNKLTDGKVNSTGNGYQLEDRGEYIIDSIDWRAIEFSTQGIEEE